MCTQTSNTFLIFLSRMSDYSTYLLLIMSSLLPIAGCNRAMSTAPSSSTATATISILPAQPDVRVNQTTQLSAIQNGTPVIGGSWIVLGGTANGSIDSTGVFHAPQIVPSPNNVTVAYILQGTTYTATIAVWNPQPLITSVSSVATSSSTTLITVQGQGFIPASQILINASPIITSYADSTHLTASLNGYQSGGSPLNIVIRNPDPGASVSASVTLSQPSESLAISPKLISGGPFTLTISGIESSNPIVASLNGAALSTALLPDGSLSATGFLPPWDAGSATLTLASSPSGVLIAQQSIPIAATPVSYDVASRFSTQAAFGPRPDVVSHIQQIGLDAYITEQLGLPGVSYQLSPTPRTQFLVAAVTGNSLLRLRIAWALQTFLVSQGMAMQSSTIPYESLLERDATGNFRQIMTDITTDPSMATFLNLAGNKRPMAPNEHPNQNYARELMQLFTLGPNLLNDDGSEQLDTDGNPIPTYTQAEVVDLSRVLTGWVYAPPVNPEFTAYGVDYSQPLVVNESWHDASGKTIIGATPVPPGLSTTEDRDNALDVIFKHPNLPPHVSRILIQRLVKSAPSAAYIDRISKVFEDDGAGVRGNMSAVVRAILLDPEARVGDTTPSGDDGFILDPLMSQIFAIDILQLPIYDDQPSYQNNQLGEPWWFSSTVFGYFSPDYTIPGTNVNSPEFQLLNNETSIIRSEYLWSMVTGTMPGYGTNGSSWLYSHFPSLPDAVDALDHLAFHGQMPPTEKTAIVAYCQQLDPSKGELPIQAAVFLALNSDSYLAVH